MSRKEERKKHPRVIPGFGLTLGYTMLYLSLVVLIPSSTGWIGSRLEPLGIHVAYTQLGVTVALVFIGLPFVVRTVQPVLEDLDKEVEEAARTLGASGWQTFWHVTLPNIIWSVLYRVILTNARAGVEPS